MTGNIKLGVTVLLVCLLCFSSGWGQTKDYAVSDPELAAGAREFGRKHALVMGIENKKDPLIWAVDDAVEIGWVLKERFGFDVTCAITRYPHDSQRKQRAKALDALVGIKYTDQDGLLELIDRVVADAGVNDQILIYFSGHGKPDKVSKEVGYLIPYNGDFEKPSTTLINMDRFETLSKRMPARHVMFILDSCYSGIAGAFSTMSPTDPTQYSKKDIKSFMGSRARHILTAGRTSETAQMLPDREMSAFAFYLKNALESEAGYSRSDYTKDGIILASELKLYLETKMTKDNRVNHTPCFFNFTENDGQFVFVPKEQVNRPAVSTGKIKVLSDPIGAKIFMGNQFLGAAPVDINDLSPARYRLTAKLENQTREKQVIVRENRKALVTFVFDPVPTRTRLHVIPTPEGSRVRIVNNPEKYYKGIALEKGQYKLEVSSPGYKTKTQWVTVSGIEDMDVYVELRSLTASRPSQSTASRKTDEKKPIKKEHVSSGQKIKIISLRSVPKQVSLSNFKKEFDLDSKRRPQKNVANDYQDNNDGTITDHATGLMWQKEGSPGSIYLKDVPDYINNLNRKRFAGFSDWRLPTIPELMSLIEPKGKKGGLYIDPLFDKRQWWCWSSDVRSGGGAWSVTFYFGFVTWDDPENRNFVRAVRLRQ